MTSLKARTNHLSTATSGPSLIGSLVGLMWSLIIVVLMNPAAGFAGPVSTKSTRLYLNYSAKPDPQAVAAFDLCILDPAAEADLHKGHSLGHRYLAYISTVEARPGSPFAKQAAVLGIPVIGKNEAWGSGLLDIAHPRWPQLIEWAAKQAADKGYDGFFLDTLDSASLIAKQSPARAAADRKRIITMIRELRRRFPAKKILVNRGFDLLDDIRPDIAGVLVESVFQTADPKTREYRAVPAKDSEWAVGRIHHAQALGLPVFVVDYVDPRQPDLAKKTAERLKEIGCTPFITTPDLNGVALAPLSQISRRIITLYGWDARHAGRPGPSPDATLAAASFRSPLEWMGYQVEMLDIGASPLPAIGGERPAGVILDDSLLLRPDQQLALARWLIGLKKAAVPILFAGRIPFTADEVKEQIAAEFGIGGTLSAIPAVKKTGVAKLDGSVMSGTAKLVPLTAHFADLTAPLDSEVFISLRGEDRQQVAVRFDPVFVAPWGGMCLRPFAGGSSPANGGLLVADSFHFLSKWLRHQPAFPVPDATTRDGRRVLTVAARGDGFATVSHFNGHAFCAEIIHCQILQALPLPVTVLMKPADLVPQQPLRDVVDAERLSSLARFIFSMPHVSKAEAAQFQAAAPLGGEQTIAAFEQSGSPRRVRPVAVSFSFETARQITTQAVLEKTLGWAMSQPLHPTTVADQAEAEADAGRTRIFAAGPRCWLISNEGRIRSLRIPSAAGVPDLPRCAGVSGWKTDGEVTYIHLTGRPLVELALADSPSPGSRLHLVESSAGIVFHELSAQSALIETGGWAAVETVFGGLRPGASLEIRNKHKPGRLIADASGQVRLALPPRSVTTLAVSPPDHAAVSR